MKALRQNYGIELGRAIIITPHDHMTTHASGFFQMIIEHSTVLQVNKVQRFSKNHSLGSNTYKTNDLQLKQLQCNCYFQNYYNTFCVTQDLAARHLSWVVQKWCYIAGSSHIVLSSPRVH